MKFRIPPADAGLPVPAAHERPTRTRRLGRVAAAVLVAVLTLAVGCGAGGEGDAVERSEDAAEGPRGGTPTPGTVDEDEAPRCEGGGFVASGESGGGEAGAADRIEGSRFQIYDGYERLILDFGEEAGVPRWTVESPDQGGYVRIRLPSVASTTTAHEGLVGSVLDEFYVVRDSGGGLFVDVFATHEFRYRVTEKPEAGQLAVDFCGVRQEIDFPPTTGDKAVVLQPREAEEIESPIDVRGYARFFEGQVTVSLLDRERDVISSTTVRANDWTEAWGLFETTLGFTDYEGLATIRVGSRSPKDGSFVGTETEVFLESSGSG